MQSFDDDNSIFGTGINKAINSIPINKIVSDLRDTSATTFDGNINATTLSYYGNLNAVVVPGIILNTVPNGFIRVNSLTNDNGKWVPYQGPGGNIIYVSNPNSTVQSYNTSADKFAILSNQPSVSRIINAAASTKQYLNVDSLANKLSDVQRSDLTDSASSLLTPGITLKTLSVSGIPMSIPGQINVGLTKYNPSIVTYTTPVYTPPILPVLINTIPDANLPNIPTPVLKGTVNSITDLPIDYKGLPGDTFITSDGHQITWDGRKIHYRSSYEKDYYEKLDEQKIYYETEKLRLFYFDTEKNKRRIAIPDIFIPSENLIIEIKSFWTHNEKNWKDRLKTYKKLKYKIKLVIGESRKNIKEINY